MILEEEFVAKGHPNITARHRTTLEITKENFLTKRGDCIIAVSSEKSVKDLRPEIKENIRRGWFTALSIEAEGESDYVIGVGDPRLRLEDPVRIIVRRSSFIDEKTLMIRSNKSARDINRELVNKIKREEALVRIKVLVSKDLQELLDYIKR